MAMAEGRLPRKLEQSGAGDIFGPGTRGWFFSANCHAEGPKGRSAPPLARLLQRTFAEQLWKRYNSHEGLRIERLLLRSAARRIEKMAAAALAGKRTPERMLRKIQIEAEGMLRRTEEKKGDGGCDAVTS